MTPASTRVSAPPGHLVATEELPGQPTGRCQVRVPAVGDGGPDGLQCRVGSGGVAAAVAEDATWRR